MNEAGARLCVGVQLVGERGAHIFRSVSVAFLFDTMGGRRLAKGIMWLSFQWLAVVG